MRVLVREGAYVQTSGIFYVTVVQEVLLYESDMWVVSLHIGRTLVGFHHRVARILTGHKLQKGLDGVWLYPPLEEVMAELGLHEVDTFISRRHNTVSQYIMIRSIMDLCLSAERRPGTRV